MTTFALQTLGCDVAAINTVSFSKSAAQQHVVLSFPIVNDYFSGSLTMFTTLLISDLQEPKLSTERLRWLLLIMSFHTKQVTTPAIDK